MNEIDLHPETDHTDLEGALERHLAAHARHLDVADGDATVVPMRARRQRRTDVARRVTASAAAVLVAAGGIVALSNAADDDTSVDTVEQPGVVEGEGIPAPAAEYDASTGYVTPTVLWRDEAWSITYADTAGMEPVLVRSTDGATWTPVDLDLDGSDVTVAASEDHLLVLVNDGAGGFVPVTSTDGETFEVHDAIDGGGEQAYAFAAGSATDVFVAMETPDADTLALYQRDELIGEAIAEAYPDHNGYGWSSDDDSRITEIEVFGPGGDGDLLFRGPPEELGLELPEVGPAGDQPQFLYRQLVLDGAAFVDVTPPPLEDGGGFVRSIRSNAGLVLGTEAQTLVSTDGRTWESLDVPWYHGGLGHLVQTDVGVFAEADGATWRADTIAGPWQRVQLPSDLDGFGGYTEVVPGEESVALVQTAFPESDLDVIDGGDTTATTVVAPDPELEQVFSATIVIERNGHRLTTSLLGGGLLETADGQAISISPDDLGGEGSDVVAMDPDDPDRVVFSDPTSGVELFSLDVDEVFAAIAEQHPHLADAVDQIRAGRSSTSSESFSQVGTEVSVAEGATVEATPTTTRVWISDDGVTFRAVDLDDDEDVYGRTVLAGPDGSYLVLSAGPDGDIVAANRVTP